jgi:hypothetical protein
MTDALFDAGPITAPHPCPYTDEILAAIAPILRAWRLPVHDPFAGEGRRLGHLCDWFGLDFTGTELEPEFIVDRRVRVGDSTRADTYPAGDYCITTSPGYPNGMADHFNARDGSRRHTYRQALGHPLHENNMGRYTVRRGRRAEANYWRIADQSVDHWPARAIVNVSDFLSSGNVYPLVDRWVALLASHGYRVIDMVQVATPRQRDGANGQLRVDAEAVIVAGKEDPGEPGAHPR